MATAETGPSKCQSGQCKKGKEGDCRMAPGTNRNLTGPEPERSRSPLGERSKRKSGERSRKRSLERSKKMSAEPEPERCKRMSAAEPEPSRKMSAEPEPSRKMFAEPEPCRKMFERVMSKTRMAEERSRCSQRPELSRTRSGPEESRRQGQVLGLCKRRNSGGMSKSCQGPEQSRSSEWRPEGTRSCPGSWVEGSKMRPAWPGEIRKCQGCCGLGPRGIRRCQGRP